MLKVKKDQNYIVKLEKAIEKKYGTDAIQNPKAGWTAEKEKEHIENSKEFYKKQYEKKQASERIEKEGFFLSKKLLNKESNRVCPVCSVYSFEMKDDLYMGKYDCCFKCYIKWVEGREERWFDGWRPNIEEIDNGNNV